MMSMPRYIEGVAPDTEVTLFYAFRTERDVIFGEELQRLQNNFLDSVGWRLPAGVGRARGPVTLEA